MRGLYKIAFLAIILFPGVSYGQDNVTLTNVADSYQQIGPTRGVVLIKAGVSHGQARELASQCGLTGCQAVPQQRDLRCGKPLPQGMARQLVPVVMRQKLPCHQEYEWRVVGQHLILVNPSSGVVADVLHDVFK